ncbi:cytochrome P450 [Rhodococcus jostii]|uniref:Cytochrome P450 n=1 Tax=Rhodococcus jostii TaxID=132919 RepID=A0A1H4ITP1_RHOJO|nr:cytochrome P450 [Rhodococcus jostii]SEB36668.1 Cytochrome P450 [Rhodococcus jostii]
MSATTLGETESESARASALLHALFSGSVTDPYPLYEELRELGDGIHWSDDMHAYAVFRYEDVRKIGSDPGLFSSDVFWQSPQSFHDPDNSEHRRFIEYNSRLFMFSDPPVHTRIRSIFRHAFTPQAIQAWRPLVEEVTAELLENYHVGDDIDIMPGFAADVPVALIAAILGVPKQKRSQFRAWSLAYALTFDPSVVGEARDQAITTTLELMDYLRELADERRAEPTDDLISLLVHTETTDGDHLQDVELLAQLTILLAAGNETTTSLIGNGLSILLDHPEARAELTADPSKLPTAIEEMLRYEAPLHFLFRKTTRETQLGDHVIPEGTVLLPSPGSANRDPRHFDNPDVFDISRPDNKHLTFFHGIHFCVGAPLARLEGAVVFEHLLKHYPDFSAGSEPALRTSHSNSPRTWKTRPVRL